MAAAEYFSNRPMVSSTPAPYPQHQSQTQIPASYSQQNQLRPHLETQQPPPPYQEHQGSVHFVPSPAKPYAPGQSFSGHQERPQNVWSQSPQVSYYQPQPQQSIATQHRPSQSYNSPPSNGYGTSLQNPQYLTPYTRPYAYPNASQYSLDNGGYHSDPEPHRRKHKQSQRRDSGETRDSRSKSSSRSTNADAFVGAAGGGLIGDLIFPGLGTLGGAAIGWLGGKDYGKHRKDRETERAEEQKKWEEKHRPERRHRSRS